MTDITSPPSENSYRRSHDWIEGLLSQRSGMIGLSILLVHLTFILLGPFLVPYDSALQDSNAMLLPPSAEHWFGTDKLGRDIFTRTILGGREAIIISLLATAFAMIWGGILGTYLALIGGRVDEWTMRLIDALLSLPWILIAMLFVKVLGTGTIVLVLVLGVTYGFAVVRIARSAALDVIAQDYVLSAIARGHGRGSIVWRELMPNIRDSMAVEAAMQMSWMIMGFSSMTFLGFGITPPTPDWGLMISDARGAMPVAPWAAIAPMVALASLIIGINLTADALAKALGVDRSQKAPI